MRVGNGEGEGKDGGGGGEGEKVDKGERREETGKGEERRAEGGRGVGESSESRTSRGSQHKCIVLTHSLFRAFCCQLVSGTARRGFQLVINVDAKTPGQASTPVAAPPQHPFPHHTQPLCPRPLPESPPAPTHLASGHLSPSPESLPFSDSQGVVIEFTQHFQKPKSSCDTFSLPFPKLPYFSFYSLAPSQVMRGSEANPLKLNPANMFRAS